MIFIPMSLDAVDCEAQASELLDAHRPSALIAIEKLSPNRKGIIHGSTGISYHEHHAKPHFLFDEARRRGIVTAGIGDGGNEVGFGKVAELVADIVPAGRVCACPCGAGRRPASTLIDEDDLERMLERASTTAPTTEPTYARCSPTTACRSKHTAASSPSATSSR